MAETQLWHVGPSFINKAGRFFGSVIYEEYGTDDLCLNFVTAQFARQKGGETPMKDYPQ